MPRVLQGRSDGGQHVPTACCSSGQAAAAGKAVSMWNNSFFLFMEALLRVTLAWTYCNAPLHDMCVLPDTM